MNRDIEREIREIKIGADMNLAEMKDKVHEFEILEPSEESKRMMALNGRAASSDLSQMRDRLCEMLPQAHRILVAEDEERIVNIMVRVLGKHGVVPDVAADGEEADRKISQNEYDLVFLNLYMPKKNGLDILRDHGNGHAQFCVISGYVDFEARKLIAETGSLVFEKPFDFADVVRRSFQVTTRRIKRNSLEGSMVDPNAETKILPRPFPKRA